MNKPTDNSNRTNSIISLADPIIGEAEKKALCDVIDSQWLTMGSRVAEFEKAFENLKGEILEGGESLDDVLRNVETFETRVCLPLIELALHIECAAFDLYRTMAEEAKSERAAQAFLAIAQAEKTHMKDLVAAIGQCE